MFNSYYFISYKENIKIYVNYTNNFINIIMLTEFIFLKSDIWKIKIFFYIFKRCVNN